jgi:hypothetical protein
VETTDNKPFREKYFDEAFPEWHTCYEKNDMVLINADAFLGPFPTEDAEALTHQYMRVRKALWEAVKYDYKRFTELRDL